MLEEKRNNKPDVVLKKYWGNKEHIHYAMPMRIMGYDYGAYKKQYDNNAVKYKNGKGLSSDEFLSKMRKTDKFMVNDRGMAQYHYMGC